MAEKPDAPDSDDPGNIVEESEDYQWPLPLRLPPNLLSEAAMDLLRRTAKSCSASGRRILEVELRGENEAKVVCEEYPYPHREGDTTKDHLRLAIRSLEIATQAEGNLPVVSALANHCTTILTRLLISLFDDEKPAHHCDDDALYKLNAALESAIRAHETQGWTTRLLVCRKVLSFIEFVKKAPNDRDVLLAQLAEELPVMAGVAVRLRSVDVSSVLDSKSSFEVWEAINTLLTKLGIGAPDGARLEQYVKRDGKKLGLTELLLPE